MGALVILPLLLLFGLLDLGSSGDEGDDADSTADGADANDPEMDGRGETESVLRTDLTGPGNDVVNGGRGSDLIDGQGGNDRLSGLGGEDYLEGGDGSDVLRGGDGYDVLGGGAGSDKLVGGNSGDVLLGNADDDLLVGQDGSDILMGGSGADYLSGGDGDDYLYSFTTTDLVFRADDVPVNELTTAHVHTHNSVAAANPVASFDEVQSLLTARGIGPETLLPSAPDGQVDTLEGGNGHDVLYLGAGDIGIGGRGDDSFVLEFGNRSGAAAQVTDFGNGNDVIVINHATSEVPEITIDTAGADALVLANGAVVAVVAGQGGTLSLGDILSLRSF